MNSEKKIEVVCFGEVLWDNLPSGRLPGGAPMNVAYHLNKLGVTGRLISQVGNDQDGRELIDELTRLGIDVQHCKLDRWHKTSTVEVSFTEEHEAKYEIVFPAAWDFIADPVPHSDLVLRSDAFVFGSLSCRHEVTKITLLKLLAGASYKVFDVNLRVPHYDMQTLEHLLGMTDLLKINLQELLLLTSPFQPGPLSQEQRVALLQSKFGIAEVVLTKGKDGAIFFDRDNFYTQSSFPVDVVDTVGSGDSFLAAFLAKKLGGCPPTESLAFASALAAFVTSKKGACPTYQISELEVWRNGLK